MKDDKEFLSILLDEHYLMHNPSVFQTGKGGFRQTVRLLFSMGFSNKGIRKLVTKENGIYIFNNRPL